MDNSVADRIERLLVEFQPMSPDEFERTLNFLLQNQAKFDASLARVDAQLEKLAGKTDRIADGVIGLTSIVGDLTQRVRDNAEHSRETDAKLDRVGDYIQSVESHLNVVIDMFERHMRENHGQRPS
jgi:hypothetical protein